MGIQLKVRNFRCLRNVDWSPDGVCVLVGPNGSGKTTLFDACNFLRLVFSTDVNQAIAESGGAYFRHLDAVSGDGVSFELTEGSLTWQLGISMAGGPFNISAVENLNDAGKNIFRRLPQHHTQLPGNISLAPGDPSAALQILYRLSSNETMSPPQQQFHSALSRFVLTLNQFFSYGVHYALQQLRQSGSQVSAEMQLSAGGANAFAVLRNWRDKRDFRPAYDFVVKQVCKAFPGVSDEIEFDFAGTITSLRLVNAIRSDTIPVNLAPNGWLTALLHLMAVAGASPGTVVLIDEFENSLHPFAIRRLVQGMREWASDRQLTVVLSGHSPALLDEFRDCPSQVFVMELAGQSQQSMPRRLTDYHDAEWLKHYSLGELYRHDEFGAPRNRTPNSGQALSATK